MLSYWRSSKPSGPRGEDEVRLLRGFREEVLIQRRHPLVSGAHTHEPARLGHASE